MFDCVKCISWKSYVYGFPFKALDASKCVATGRGIQPTGLRVGDRAQFRVETKNAGLGGQLAVKVTGPNGTDENVNVSMVSCCILLRFQNIIFSMFKKRFLFILISHKQQYPCGVKNVSIYLSKLFVE